MNKLLLMVTICFLLVTTVTMVSASQDTLGVFGKNDCITLMQICGTCTYNNVSSVVLPNSTRVILDEQMTRRNAEYNYTFCTTNLIGEYIVNGVGDLDGTNTAWAYDFDITDSGHRGISIEWLIVIFLVLAYGIILFGFAQEETPPVTMGALILIAIALYIWVNGFGLLGTKSILPQIFAGANFVVGATLSIYSLKDLWG